ncbi:MAG: dicarboxylate/amino acid:cation symporter [Spirochaetales bacterium]
MKIWIRYFLGIVAGVAIGFFIDDLEANTAIWEELSELAVNVGTYMLIPLVFFGTIVSVHDLRENERTIATFAKAIAAMLVFTSIAIGLGLFAVIFINPGSLPIILEEPPIPTPPTLIGLLQEAVPANALSALSLEPEHLISALVLAVALGVTIASDNRYAALLEDISDGLCRVFYRINGVIVQVLGIGLVAVTVHTVLTVRTLGDQTFFGPIILVIGISAVVLTLGIYPLFVYLFGGRWNPAPWLLGMVPPALAALLSGNLYFAGGSFAYLGHENLGVKRQVGGALVPFTLLFARAGSAMVAAMAFIVVLNSYSGLDVEIADVTWVALSVFVFSFGLVAVPGSGVLVLLGMLSAGHGQGFEEAFLIVRPAAPILLGIAAYVDVMTAGAILRIVAGSERQRALPDVQDYI